MWHAIYVIPRREKSAVEYLTTNGVDVFCPTIKLIVRRATRGSNRSRFVIREEVAPAFPGYLFATVCNRLYGLVRDPSIKVGIMRIVSCGGIPSFIHDELVEMLRHERRTHSSLAHLLVGRQVSAGTLAGLIATITSIENLCSRQEVSIAFSLFGKRAVVSVPALSVEAA
jgi:hypothetical protein